MNSRSEAALKMCCIFSSTCIEDKLAFCISMLACEATPWSKLCGPRRVFSTLRLLLDNAVGDAIDTHGDQIQKQINCLRKIPFANNFVSSCFAFMIDVNNILTTQQMSITHHPFRNALFSTDLSCGVPNPFSNAYKAEPDRDILNEDPL